MRRDFKDPKYIKWRNQVYKRDRYTCQHPGCTSRFRLNAHHIKRWANNPPLRYDVKNGITLCEKHHTMTFGCEERYEEIFTKIVGKHTKFDIDFLRRKYGIE